MDNNYSYAELFVSPDKLATSIEKSDVLILKSKELQNEIYEFRSILNNNKLLRDACINTPDLLCNLLEIYADDLVKESNKMKYKKEAFLMEANNYSKNPQGEVKFNLSKETISKLETNEKLAKEQSAYTKGTFDNKEIIKKIMKDVIFTPTPANPIPDDIHEDDTIINNNNNQNNNVPNNNFNTTNNQTTSENTKPVEENKPEKPQLEKVEPNKKENTTPKEVEKENNNKNIFEKPNKVEETKQNNKVEEIKPNNKVEEVKPNNTKTFVVKPSTNPKPTTKPTPTPSQKTTPTQAPTPTPSPSPIPVKTDRELNDEKIASMTYKYGVKFMVRDQSRTRVGWSTGTAIYDEVKLKKVLNEIDYILSRYPAGFFKEFNSNGMSLTLNLLDQIHNGLYGLSDSEFLSNVVISVATSSYLFEETLHHEILHYIDNYISTKMYPASPEDEYIKCNPAGYTYGNPDSSLSFKYNNAQTAYFVADYGQTNYKEDRATLFPRLMRPYISGGNEFLKYHDSPLSCKARVLIKQIDNAFDTVNSSKAISWNKFVN